MIGYLQGQSSFLGISLKLFSLLKRLGGGFSSLSTEVGFLSSSLHRLLKSLQFLAQILVMHIKQTSVNVFIPPIASIYCFTCCRLGSLSIPRHLIPYTDTFAIHKR